MNESVDADLIEAGVLYRDRQRDPDRRREAPRYTVEVDRGFQAPVILGEGHTQAEAFEKAQESWKTQPEPRKPSYEELETTAQTWHHIDVLRKFLRIASVELLMRGETHDRSKLDRAEVDVFTAFTPKLKSTTYGSEEYKAFLSEMKPALDHHYGHNRHHPEFFERGMRGMNLVDLLECFCDWWASSMRHADGDIRRSIGINAKRFDMPEALVDIFLNTVSDFEPAVEANIGGAKRAHAGD
jgi:Family of unknown function (DUF5662)